MEDSDLYWRILEKFGILMYDRSSTAANVDEARLDMFATKQRSYESIPPTRAALLQHTRLVMCGPRQSSVSQKQRTLQSGNGRRLVRNGRSSG